MAHKLIWATLAALFWLVMASFTFLWMSGLLNNPAIPAWTRPWQWLSYARLFGRSTNEQIYLVVSAVLAAAPLAAYVRTAVMRPRLRAARSNERPPALVRAFSDLHGQANWMTERRLHQLAMGGHPIHGGVVYGTACRADLHPRQDGGNAPLLVDRCLEDATHGLLFLGSGGGKTMGYVVPSLDSEVGWRSNVFVNDPSSQAGQMCADMRRKDGQRVVFIGPPEPGMDRVGFNVLAWIDPAHPLFEEHVWSAVDTLGRELPKTESNDPNGMFKIQGKALQACILADMLIDPSIPAQGKNPRLFAERIATPERQMKGLLETINLESTSRMARLLAGTLMDVHPKTFSGICVEATADLRWLMTESYADLVSGTALGSLKAAEFTRGNVAVFLQLGVKTMQDTPQIGRAILNAVLNDIYRTDGQSGKRYLLLLDEIDLFGRLQALLTAGSQGRKYGVTVLGMWHSLGQMEGTWGKDGMKAWRANASWEAYSAMDPETAKDVSERCGEYTVVVETEGRSSNWQNSINLFGRSRGTNQSTGLQKRRLLSPYEAERGLRKDEQIVFRRGEASPIRSLKAYYFRRPDMAARVGRDQFRIAAE